MRVLFSLIAIVLIAAAGCSGSGLPTSRPFGLFNMKDSADGFGGYVVNPTAIFFQGQNANLVFSDNPPDSCVSAAYYPQDTMTAVLSNQLDAGSPIAFQTGAVVGELLPDTIVNHLIVYRNFGPPALHTPGADVVFTIPGAAGGVSAATFHVVTPKVLVIGPVDPNPPDSLHLTWIQGQPGVAAVNFQLIYESKNASKPDSQIVCSLYDDGDAYVDKKTTAKWKAAFATYQEVVAFRWVTKYQPSAGDLLLFSYSEFDTVKTTFP